MKEVIFIGGALAYLGYVLVAKRGQPDFKGWLTGAIVGLVGVGLAVWIPNAYQHSSTTEARSIPNADTTVIPETKRPPEFEFTSLADAIVAFKSKMTDFDDADISQGAAFLALWGAKHMSWEELQAVDQGKYALVMKDPDSQRGKRLCTHGGIIEIEVDNGIQDKVYLGGMIDEAARVYRFVAVKSTGDLVGGSVARFCGIVTGKNNYQNSGGGVEHAVHLVGMFDLPENKK